MFSSLLDIDVLVRLPHYSELKRGEPAHVQRLACALVDVKLATFDAIRG